MQQLSASYDRVAHWSHLPYHLVSHGLPVLSVSYSHAVAWKVSHVTGGRACRALVLHVQCSVGAENVPGCVSGVDGGLCISHSSGFLREPLLTLSVPK